MNREFVTEIKTLLFGGTKKFNCQVVDRRPSAITLLYLLEKAHPLGSLTLPKGTLSFGYFREDCNFNIYHFVAPCGETLATYFNICDRTRITPSSVCWRDLVIDILVTPHGTCEVLDEDELPDELEQEFAMLIRGTREYIVQHHRELVAQAETASAAHLAAVNRVTGPES